MALRVGVVSGRAVKLSVLATGLLGMNFPLHHRLRKRDALCVDREEKSSAEMRA